MTPKVPRNASELAMYLEGINRNLSRLADRINKLDVELDRLQLELHESINALSPTSNDSRLVFDPALPPRGRRGGLRNISAAMKARLREQAESGFATFSIERRSDGHSRVRINAVDFEAPPVLTDMLEFLAGGPDNGTNGRTGDGFVAWRTLEEIQSYLESRNKRAYRIHTVRHNVSRLRTLLWQHWLNPFFVQSAPGRGIRLAWRHSKPDRDGTAEHGTRR